MRTKVSGNSINRREVVAVLGTAPSMIGRCGKEHVASKESILISKHTGDDVIKFDSITQAVNFVGAKDSGASIGRVAREGGKRTAYGYKWRYAA